MTLSEIAKSVGVSPATISIVRCGRPGVSPAMRRKIQLRLEENGYAYKAYVIPEESGSAAAPARKKRQIRLLKYFQSSLLTDKNEGFVDAILDAVAAHAQAAGYAVLLSTVSQEAYPAFLAQVEAAPCDGLLVLATEMSRAEIMMLSGLHLPVVVLDSDHPGLPFSSVTMDNRDIAYQAVSHLLALGTRDVGYLRSAIRTGNFIGRENGYFEALKAQGISPRDSRIFDLTPSISGACRDMAAWLEGGRQVPKALFADNDIIAVGAMRALAAHGLRIPADTAVIGVDNTLLAQVSSPALSSMQISRSALGEMAITALLRQIEAPGGERVHLRVCGHLMARESTKTQAAPAGANG